MQIIYNGLKHVTGWSYHSLYRIQKPETTINLFTIITRGKQKGLVLFPWWTVMYTRSLSTKWENFSKEAVLEYKKNLTLGILHLNCYMWIFVTELYKVKWILTINFLTFNILWTPSKKLYMFGCRFRDSSEQCCACFIDNPVRCYVCSKTKHSNSLILAYLYRFLLWLGTSYLFSVISTF